MVSDPSIRSALPAAELDHVAAQIRAQPAYLTPEGVASAYRDLGLAIAADPFAPDVTQRVTAALTEGRPLSVVRIGDGEANMLAFGADPATPALDRYCIARVLDRRRDTFAPDEAWMLALREMLTTALHEADIVGVIGLWGPRPDSPEGFAALVAGSPRLATGHWRAVDHMLHLARGGALAGKLIASAHLYFAILARLPDILGECRRVLLISSSTTVADAVRRRFPDHMVEWIAVGQRPRGRPRPASPDFLAATEAALPRDLAGTLCLVGAGPWAEIYCTWIKRRGGVGVDIGSGFDLMDGRVSRPVHRALGLHKGNPYAL